MQVQRDGIASKKSLAGWVCRFGWRGGGAGSWGWLWVGCVLHVAQAAQTGPRPPILPSGSQQTTRWPTIIPRLLICALAQSDHPLLILNGSGKISTKKVS